MPMEYDGTQSYLHSSVLLVEARVFSDAELVVNSNKLMLQHTARIDSHLDTPNPLVRNIGHGSPACVVSP
ncbi:hypothetical protein CY34DRAFT_807761 [Suillus luteus UH-Slu-Lm8-n1]|uniref:Uncharacterized protein n=1 Tax=Suillus luteus UH-Slu-Lm8-n1 TaxID=930992 RepID=A0A0D0ADU5_9AGAM|nr:hypothetical protein CY34DRAFT_807761 [Suillus luteus UH-Slu-Lm8-n1]